MHEHVINPADVIPVVSLFVFELFLRSQAVEETDFAQDYGVRGLEEVLTDPAEYGIRFQEALGTCGNQGASPNYRAVACLLI